MPAIDDEAAIRALIEARVAALRDKDAASAVATLATDVVAFEAAGPLQVPASAAIDVAGAQAWLDSFDGTVETEIRELVVHVSGDVGFAHSLNRLRARRSDGSAMDFWMRSTLGFLKRDGEWKIAHGHTSVPFHADGSFRAALDLEP